VKYNLILLSKFISGTLTYQSGSVVGGDLRQIYSSCETFRITIVHFVALSLVFLLSSCTLLPTEVCDASDSYNDHNAHSRDPDPRV